MPWGLIGFARGLSGRIDGERVNYGVVGIAKHAA